MCGVPVNAAPDMTGLGGKARMVTSTITDKGVDESKSSSEGKEAVKPAENLLLEVRFLFEWIMNTITAELGWFRRPLLHNVMSDCKTFLNCYFLTSFPNSLELWQPM